VLPGILVFGLGLASTVSPLTAAILGDIDQRHAGIGSAINNAIARVAGLLAVAAIGALIAARFASTVDAASRGHAAPRSQAFLAEARQRPLVTSVPKDVGANGDVKATLEDASVGALHAALWAMGAALAVGGLISAAGIRNPRRQ
jgi:hypothetical protein